MSVTAPGIKGVVTDFADATPSATVAFQAVSTPASALVSIPLHVYRSMYDLPLSYLLKCWRNKYSNQVLLYLIETST